MNLLDIEIEELTLEEQTNTFGGDDFMHDLGYAIGSFMGWLGDNSEMILDSYTRHPR